MYVAPLLLLKKTVYTNIDTSASAPSNQGALIRQFDRSWRLRGWNTKILLTGETVPLHSLVVPYWWINFSYHNPPKRPPVVRSFGDEEWMTADVVKFLATASEEDILNCGRSLV